MGQNRKIPMRTCIGCRQSKEKKELIRIVKDKEGNISIDEIGKSNGRGAYICENMECLEKAIKGKKLEKNFETEISEKMYEDLKYCLRGEKKVDRK